MAEAISYKAVAQKFDCGTDFSHLTVVNFVGPGGAKACAYCCNMNIDLDGEPQAYAPLSKPKLRPSDNLGNAGWKKDADNEILKKKYEAGKLHLAELEKKKADLVAKAKPGLDPAKPAPAPGKAAHDPAMEALDKEIAHKKKELRQQSFEHTNANGDPAATNPKNFEKIFWKWYGVTALTPEQARSASSYMEMSAKTLTLRKPVLDETSIYEDVFGRFPVVQSIFEPGPEYFVSPLPRAANTNYPRWDQRYFLPHDGFSQEPFAALGRPLAHATGLHLNDMVFAVRLDSGTSLAFPFRDTGYKPAVAECSFAAFTALGGVYHPEREGAAKFPNDFLVLYLAFPKSVGQTPASILAKFATASNAFDFPMILAFIAQATVDAKARGSKVVHGDPLKNFEKWKNTASNTEPLYFDVINQSLSDAAGSPFIQSMMRKHASILPQGPFLRPPGKF